MTEFLVIQLLLNFESRKMHILVKQVMTWISNIPLSCHQLLFSLRSTVRHHIIFAASRNLTSFSFKRYLHLTLSLSLSLFIANYYVLIYQHYIELATCGNITAYKTPWTHNIFHWYDKNFIPRTFQTISNRNHLYY